MTLKRKVIISLTDSLTATEDRSSSSNCSFDTGVIAGILTSTSREPFLRQTFSISNVML